MEGEKLGLIGKIILGVGAVASLFSGSAKAGYVDTMFKNSGMNNSVLGIWHVNGASEGYGFGDATFNDGLPEPALYIYSRTSIPSHEKLAVDARGLESMSTINGEISGRGLTSPVSKELEVTIYDDGENFANKKIIGEVYQRIDDGQGGYTYAKIGDYDIKNMNESRQTIPLTISNGITKDSIFYPSHKILYKFYNTNIADFNNDGKVDFKDYAEFANDYGKQDGNYLTDISGPLGEADGNVDIFDLNKFCDNWLQ